MTKQTQDSWSGFTGKNFLKTDDVKNEQDAFAVVSLEIVEEDDGNQKPRLTLEKNEENYLFYLNVTNSLFCKNAGIKEPKTLIGKKIYFKKVQVTSPKTKKEVESLRISKLE